MYRQEEIDIQYCRLGVCAFTFESTDWFLFINEMTSCLAILHCIQNYFAGSWTWRGFFCGTNSRYMCDTLSCEYISTGQSGVWDFDSRFKITCRMNALDLVCPFQC